MQWKWSEEGEIRCNWWRGIDCNWFQANPSTSRWVRGTISCLDRLFKLSSALSLLNPLEPFRNSHSRSFVLASTQQFPSVSRTFLKLALRSTVWECGSGGFFQKIRSPCISAGRGGREKRGRRLKCYSLDKQNDITWPYFPVPKSPFLITPNSTKIDMNLPITSAGKETTTNSRNFGNHVNLSYVENTVALKVEEAVKVKVERLGGWR